MIPGVQRKFIVQLTDVFDLAKNGKYMVHASHEIMSIINTNIPIHDGTNPFVTNVISADATFYITNSIVK